MKKILYLTNVIRRLGIMNQTLEKLQKEGKLHQECACKWIGDDTEWSAYWQNTIEAADFLLVKWMGTGLDTPFLRKMLTCLEKNNIPFYIDAAGSKEGEMSQNVADEDILAFKNYAAFGGEMNYLHTWEYANAIFEGNKEAVPKPDPTFWDGIYHPRAQKVYQDVEEYKKDFCREGVPTIGFLFYRDEWVWEDLNYQKALIEEIERQGMNAIAVFSNGLPDESLGQLSLNNLFTKYFTSYGVPRIDCFVNILKFSLTNSKSLTIDFLKQWNVPFLQAYTTIASFEEWKNTFEGMNPMEISISVSLPEFDGCVHGIPVANKLVLENGDIRYMPIQERVVRMVSKAQKWANLRRKENAAKKIAIIFHNYPPRNSNIGSAVGLDTIESVRRMLKEMQERGYRVEHIPNDTKDFINELTHNATNDRALLTDRQIEAAEKITGAQYKEFFSSFEQKIQAQMIKDWEEAPGTVMEYDGDILVPGTMNGNVFVTVQPPRGFGEDPAKIYHDPFTAPTHQYLAFYRWIRDIWQADAVAHIGTHGSLEWLPGKNAGLDCTCYPDLSLGDLPNIYPYHITITGEGVQAKRRGAACLVEYLPAPQTTSGTYDELAELEKIMDEYLHFAANQPENLAALEELVKEKVAQANLTDEVPYDANKPFSEYVASLHNYLSDLKNMEVHMGLHILGQAPQGEELVEYLRLLTRLDNGEIPSLTEALARTYGFGYYELLEQSNLIYQPLNITYGMLIDRIAEQVRTINKILIEKDFTSEAKKDVLKLDFISAAGETEQKTIRKVVDYICDKIHPNLVLTSQELTNVMLGFNGEYIEPGPSGSPAAGGADLLPTGRNFYGVDPRTLPTPAAWEIGKILGDQVVERFIAEEGYYPEAVGMVLWAGSNMRSHGQCIAEFLYLMGIKPIWQTGSMRVVGLEPISLTELKRPRIDVTGRISGMFRDAMPSAAQLLDKAVLLAASLDEPYELNFIKKHVEEDTRELIEEEGLTHEDAWRQAAYRVFGDQEGCYGAGVAALLEAKNWESIDDIADVFVRWGAHAYGGTTRGKFLPKQFRKRMSILDVTIKNEDNHETNMLSSDDYNAYHGGMIAAVRSIKGSAPKSYCGDSTDRKKVVMHSVQEEAKRIFRSESINPKFIEGMMKHGYKGAADMANMIAHSFQWDATSAVMEDWMYEKYAEKYTFDPKVQEWLKDVNPWALERMTEVLLEAEQRGLWNAKPETKEKLMQLMLEMEGELEDRADEND
ncbi:MAG: cobaltochelatase subunit CobN [Phascolarctobacterium sp.]|nr:cobaltochelatase subunit CobN [Phascolarctobacterium sp.]